MASSGGGQQGEGQLTGEQCPPVENPGAHLRTLLANERTFLAWVRTGIALMAFGFVVEKAGSLLQILATDLPSAQATYVRYSGAVGIILMLAGAFVIVISTARFWRIDRRIRRGIYSSSVALDLFVAMAITVVAVAYILFLIYQAATV